MKKIILTIIILYSSIILKSQNAMPLSLSIDELSNDVVYLMQKTSDTTSLSGTATIIKHKDLFFLLTAAHVAKTMKNTAEIIFRGQNDKPVSILISLFTYGPFLNWTFHPIADIAIIHIKPFNDDSKARLEAWSFPSAQISKIKAPLSRDLDLIAIGYPIIDYVGEYFSPLSFNSKASSGLITLPRADSKQLCTFILLENPSIQGYSGGPVFESVKKAMYFGGNHTVLVGVIHGTFSDNTGGKLAAITPSFYLWDLIKD